VLEDARKLLNAGADIELILLFLRDRGFSQIDSGIAIRVLMGKSHPEAKALIHNCKTWSDRFASVQDLHEKARRALLELAASVDKDMPKIEVVGFEEDES
jgi:hypothetical protein